LKRRKSERSISFGREKQQVLHYTIVNLQQGTREWLAWRRRGIGTSDAPTIMGENPWKSTEYLLQEKCEGRRCGSNAAMAKGMELEPVARERYESKIGISVVPACLQSVKYEWLRASVDGLATDGNTIYPVKSPIIIMANCNTFLPLPICNLLISFVTGQKGLKFISALHEMIVTLNVSLMLNINSAEGTCYIPAIRYRFCSCYSQIIGTSFRVLIPTNWHIHVVLTDALASGVKIFTHSIPRRPTIIKMVSSGTLCAAVFLEPGHRKYVNNQIFHSTNVVQFKHKFKSSCGCFRHLSDMGKFILRNGKILTVLKLQPRQDTQVSNSLCNLLCFEWRAAFEFPRQHCVEHFAL